MTATSCHMKDDYCMYRRSYAPPYTCLSAALPVVPHSLFLMIAVSRNMGHATTMKVPGLNGWEISNFHCKCDVSQEGFNSTNQKLLFVQNHPIKIILSSSILFLSVTGRRFVKR